MPRRWLARLVLAAAFALSLLPVACRDDAAAPTCPWPSDTLIQFCDLPVDTPGVQP